MSIKLFQEKKKGFLQIPEKDWPEEMSHCKNCPGTLIIGIEEGQKTVPAEMIFIKQKDQKTVGIGALCHDGNDISIKILEDLTIPLEKIQKTPVNDLALLALPQEEKWEKLILQ